MGEFPEVRSRKGTESGLFDPPLSEMINLCIQSGIKHTGQKKCTHNKCEACSKVMSTFRFSQLYVLILLSSLKEEASSTVEDDPLLAAWR